MDMQYMQEYAVYQLSAVFAAICSYIACREIRFAKAPTMEKHVVFFLKCGPRRVSSIFPSIGSFPASETVGTRCRRHMCEKLVFLSFFNDFPLIVRF